MAALVAAAAPLREAAALVPAAAPLRLAAALAWPDVTLLVGDFGADVASLVRRFTPATAALGRGFAAGPAIGFFVVPAAPFRRLRAAWPGWFLGMNIPPEGYCLRRVPGYTR